MSLHLFSTPVQCTQCGTTVEDPSVQRCPNCGTRLKERRAPRRLAGVEQRYGSLRVLLGAMRFLGVIVFAIGALIFFSSLGDSRSSASQTGALFVGSILVAVVFLAAAGLFELLIDVEENTRSSFKLQQMMLEELAEGRAAAVEPDTAAAPVAATEAPAVVPAADGPPLAPAVVA
jgi:predicted RNA-binding Zn-ribbon protein involved in translation (DUF1610 family)